MVTAAPIDDEFSIGGLTFLTEFVEKRWRSNDGFRGKQAAVKEGIRLGIGRREQPNLLVVDPNHGFVGLHLVP